MKIKTWKLGEYAIGGKIRVAVYPGQLAAVRVVDYRTGELVKNKLFRWPLDYFSAEVYLNDITTSYYASKIIEWIKGVK